MSEDDAAALEQEVLEAEAAEREAFEARFPPKAFIGVARALKIREPAIFARLVRSLRDDFYDFYMDCGSPLRSKRPSRDAVKKRFSELRDAANLIASTDLSTDLWIPLSPLGEAEEEQFVTTVKRLATFWDDELTKREMLSSLGRPSHEAFHDLIIYLIYTYQQVARKPAKKPSTRRNKKGYFGDFYQFAIAAWHCLRERLPETRHLIPARKEALAEALRNHWPKKGTTGYKLILWKPQ
jgi:hypothetical protein